MAWVNSAEFDVGASGREWLRLSRLRVRAPAKQSTPQWFTRIGVLVGKLLRSSRAVKIGPITVHGLSNRGEINNCLPSQTTVASGDSYLAGGVDMKALSRFCGGLLVVLGAGACASPSTPPSATANDGDAGANPNSVAPPQLSGVAPSTANGGYYIIMDAGSSGTRLYVYKATASADRSFYSVPSIAIVSQDVKAAVPGGFKPAGACNDRGIADSTNAQISECLQALITYAKTVVPAGAGLDLAAIPIALRATAGWRTKSWDEQQRVGQQADAELAKSGFLNLHAQSIAGEFEGLYAWVALNYAARTLDKTTLDKTTLTAGILEIGGASMQVAFEPESGADQRTLWFNTVPHKIYSMSYNHLGINDAKAQYSTSNCQVDSAAAATDAGAALTSAEKFAACERGMAAPATNPPPILSEVSCFPQCGLTGTYQPPVIDAPAHYSPSFIGLGNVFAGLGDCLAPTKKSLNADNLDELGKKLCGSQADALAACPMANSTFISNYCFNTAFVSTVLAGSPVATFTPPSGPQITSDGIGFPRDSKQIEAGNNLDIGYGYPPRGSTEDAHDATAQKITTSNISWTMGWVVLEATLQN